MKARQFTICLIAALGVCYLILVAMGFFAQCQYEELRTVESPGSVHEAKLFLRKCRNDPSPIVELRMSTTSKASEYQSFDLGDASTTDIDLTWLSKESLLVTYPTSFKLRRTITDMDDVKITFKAK